MVRALWRGFTGWGSPAFGDSPQQAMYNFDVALHKKIPQKGNQMDKDELPELPNELDFEQWYCENAFHFERDPIGSRDCELQRKAWHAALAAMQNEEFDSPLDAIRAAMKGAGS